MREIKFRGYSILLNKWVYGYLVKGDENTYIVYSAYEDDYRHALDNAFIKIDSKSVGQFTGLKDEKGVEIYENDIIEATERRYFFGSDKGLQTIRFKSPVVYEDAGFIYSTRQENDSPLFSTKGILVIGNVYEHPHLLTPPSQGNK